MIDTTSTALGTNLDTRAIETLPTGRNYSSIAQVTPGVSSDANPGNADQNTITVYGSSGAENAFYIDGVNTTDVEYGFQGKELELRVHPGGRREDRRLRGGVRPLDRRHHQRHHQVGRQRVPRRRLRLLRQRLAAGRREAGRLDRRHADRLHAARTTASTSAAI